MASTFSRSFLLAWAVFANATPLTPRAVDTLNQEATSEAHQRDNTATRAFSNVQIKTSDGKCLFVDELSGDFRANLTPVQVADCGSTDGQGWDIITSGEHINVEGSMLVVSTLTQACLNFDDRRQPGNQVLLFSCGGRADGGGEVTNSQIFSFDGSARPLALSPQNAAGKCLSVDGDVIDIADCNDGDPSQAFTFGDGGGAVNDGVGNGANAGDGNAGEGNASEGSVGDGNSGDDTTDDGPGEVNNGGGSNRGNRGNRGGRKGNKKGNDQGNGNGQNDANNGGAPGASSTPCTRRTRTVTVQPTTDPTPDGNLGVQLPDVSTSSSLPPPPANGGGDGGGNGVIPTANPTVPVPVSRGGGGLLNPTAAAEAHQRDETATRDFANVEIRDPNGQCLSVDPTAGDFRQNLIPVASVECSGSPNEKWDVISAGKHNRQDGTTAPAALVVSALTQGCISFDGRRQAGDTVTLFSCGGRADGSGESDSGQLFPYIGQLSFALAPQNQNNQICILPGNDGRLTSGPCPDDGSQLFSIFP